MNAFVGKIKSRPFQVKLCRSIQNNEYVNTIGQGDVSVTKNHALKRCIFNSATEQIGGLFKQTFQIIPSIQMPRMVDRK